MLRNEVKVFGSDWNIDAFFLIFIYMYNQNQNKLHFHQLAVEFTKSAPFAMKSFFS